MRLLASASVLSRSLLVMASVALPLFGGCGGSKDLVKDAQGPAAPPPLPETFTNKCDAAKGQLRPLVVEWDAPDRAALEAQSRQGQLVVHYEGCSFEVLRRCKAPKQFAYAYTAITAKDEVVTMSNVKELYASIPVHAAKFEGKLAAGSKLSAEMRIVGEYGVPGTTPAIDQLEGDCDGATHVVTALTIGAFSFGAGADKEMSGSATVLGAGAGAKSTSQTEKLSKDGDPAACAESKRGDGNPPDRCGALLRVELAELRAKGDFEPTCKPGTKLDDSKRKCVAIEKPAKLAPEDESFTEDGSKPPGFQWGEKCFKHQRGGSLPAARAACDKALAASPSGETAGQILFSYALVERDQGDPVAACEKLGRAIAALPKWAGKSDDPRKSQQEKLGCRELLKTQ
jgi:hypothetical protein